VSAPSFARDVDWARASLASVSSNVVCRDAIVSACESACDSHSWSAALVEASSDWREDMADACWEDWRVEERWREDRESERSAVEACRAESSERRVDSVDVRDF
jgi:hypothetical protein